MIFQITIRISVLWTQRASLSARRGCTRRAWTCPWSSDPDSNRTSTLGFHGSARNGSDQPTDDKHSLAAVNEDLTSASNAWHERPRGSPRAKHQETSEDNHGKRDIEKWALWLSDRWDGQSRKEGCLWWKHGCLEHEKRRRWQDTDDEMRQLETQCSGRDAEKAEHRND